MRAKRRPSRTRRADPRAAFKAISRHQPFTHKEQQRLSVMARLALRNLTHGDGNVNCLNEVVLLTNVTLLLSEQVGQECIDVCLEAVRHIQEAGVRLKKTGRAGLTGQGMQQLQSVLDLYEQFLEHITPAQHEAAWKEMYRGLDAKIVVGGIDVLDSTDAVPSKPRNKEVV